jgi:hypothetical protein
MQEERQNESREKPGTKAWIRFDNGFPVRPCRVANLSRSGVRIVVHEPHAVAGHFSLLFRRDATPGRRCRVKRRSGFEIVAEFV